MNSECRLIAIISIVTFLQGCAFATPIDVLNGLDALTRRSNPSSPSYIYPCEPLENSGSLAAPKSSNDAASKPPASVDVSGTYISEITGKKGRLDANQGSLIVRMEQYGNQLSGRFGNFGGEFEGTIEGEKITFNWYSSWTHGIGEWQFKPGSNNLIGTWKTKSGYEGSGKWNLIKCRVTVQRVE